MSNFSKRLVALGLASFVAVVNLLPFPAFAEGSRYSLSVTNRSGLTIERMYFSSSERREWGPDQLRRDTIPSGSTFTLTGIRPGEYDIKFVDEDGDSCILRKENIFDNTSWELSQSWLLNCEFR